MSNFRDNILEAVKGEPIIGIVVGKIGYGDYDTWEHEWGGPLDRPSFASIANRVVSWEEAAPILDYEYDTGYGGTDCQPITAWTETKVVFVSQYDGSTHVEVVPRNPIDHQPYFPGG